MEDDKEEKLTWVQKKYLSYITKKLKKQVKKANIRKDIHDKEFRPKLIKMIWELGEVFELYKDEEQTIPLKQADLETMTIEELTTYLEEVIDETTDQIK